MRRFTTRLIVSSAPRGVATPYQVVLKAVEHDGRGLLAAAEVFKQFQRYYRRYEQDALKQTPITVAEGDESDAAARARLPLGKPLTQFCGRSEDVEPMTVLLLKVLCDLQRLEEMRFLFTQCLLEMDDRTPSVELFNVYLLAISMTDTFNQYEVENLVELQRAKGIAPDIVTKLSMFLLYLRLGDHNCVAWWPAMRDEVIAIIDGTEVPRYPLLPLRLQHCFQTLVRVHHDAGVMHECLQLLLRAAPERVTASMLLPYVLLSAMNAATPPAYVVEALKVMEKQEALTAATTSTGAPPDDATAVPNTSSSSSTTDPPLLNSETTIFRLLSKCAKYGDPVSAAYLRAYVHRHASFHLIAAENAPVASLLYIEALVKAGRVRSALRVLETEVPPPYQSPGNRPKLFLESRRLSLLTTDPVHNLIVSLTPLAAALHLEDPVLSLITEKMDAVEEEERSPVPVSGATLDLIVAACAYAGGAARAEAMLQLYPRYDASPTVATYVALLQVNAATSAVDGVARLPSLEREMSAASLSIDGAWLHAALDMALNARDVGAALRLANMHVVLNTGIDARHGTRLLRELATAADAVGMQKALRSLRACKTPIDPRSFALCSAVMKSLGMSPDGLKGDSAKV